MHLKDSAPAPSGYFVRPSAGGPERGPLTLENLRDLAEVEIVTTESWIRTSEESEPQPLSGLPELMGSIFPGKKSFRFKSYQKTDDVDADIAPIDVKSLYRCDASPPPIPISDASPPSMPPLPSVPPDERETPDHVEMASQTDPTFDPQALLKINREALQRARDTGNRRERRRTYFSLNGAALFRWLLAAFLFALAIWIWSGVKAVTDIFFLMLLGMLPMAGAIALTASDIIQWILDRIGSPEMAVPDFTRAERAFSEANWSKAASEYLRVLRRHPLELTAYLPAIRAAEAAGHAKSEKALHALAEKHLGARDLNLLRESLKRRKTK